MAIITHKIVEKLVHFKITISKKCPEDASVEMLTIVSLKFSLLTSLQILIKVISFNLNICYRLYMIFFW